MVTRQKIPEDDTYHRYPEQGSKESLDDWGKVPGTATYFKHFKEVQRQKEKIKSIESEKPLSCYFPFSVSSLQHRGTTYEVINLPAPLKRLYSHLHVLPPISSFIYLTKLMNSV